MKIYMRADLVGVCHIPFKTEQDLYFMDENDVQECMFFGCSDSGKAYALHPEMGNGYFESVDLDYE